jgi:hypothetical protein
LNSLRFLAFTHKWGRITSAPSEAGARHPV